MVAEYWPHYRTPLWAHGARTIAPPTNPTCNARNFHERTNMNLTSLMTNQRLPSSKPIPSARISNLPTQPKSELKNAVVALAKKGSFCSPGVAQSLAPQYSQESTLRESGRIYREAQCKERIGRSSRYPQRGTLAEPSGSPDAGAS